MTRRDDGFTLIELLVVIIIIGVLAGIGIPTYLRQREKAWRVQAVNDMKNAATAIESYATNSVGSYLAVNGATEATPELLSEGFRGGAWVSLLVVSDATNYCIEGTHVHLPAQVFVYRNTEGVVRVGGGGLSC